MIVYENNDYQFLNRVENADSLTTLYKISKITIEHVDIPDLGAHYVRATDTVVESSGTPAPGGVIFLQNGYVAIAYDSTKTSFEVKLSASYRPVKKGHDVVLTGHYSTPFSRATGAMPKRSVFLNGAVLSVFDDFAFQGIQADYICVKNGVPQAYFKVRDQSYFSLPFPCDLDKKKIAALAEYCITNSAAVYATAEAVEGIKKKPEITSAISAYREAMASWKELDVDYTMVTGFRLPASSALSNSGVICSCVTREGGRAYIKQLEGDPRQKVAAIVLDSMGLQHLLDSLNDTIDSLVSYIESDVSYADMVILLDDDFQNILSQYNGIYLQTLGELSAEALQTIRGNLVTLKESVNKVAKEHALKEIKRLLGEKYGVADGNIAIDMPISCSMPEIKELQIQDYTVTEDNRVEKSAAFTKRIKEIVSIYGGTVLLDKDKALPDDLIGAGSVNADGFLVAAYNHSMTKILEAEFEGQATNLLLFDDRIRFEKNHCRAGSWHIWCKKVSFDYLIGNGKGYVENVRVFKDAIELDIRYHFDSYDVDLQRDVSAVEEKFVNALRNKFSHTGCTVRNRGSILRDPNNVHIFSAMCRASQNVSKKHGETGTLSSADYYVTISLPKQLNLDGVSLPELTHVVHPKKDEYLAQAKANANLIVTKLQEAAALKAYLAVKPMLDSVCANYEIGAIGCIGENYLGVIVSMCDLAKISNISISYIKGILKLVSEIETEAMRNQLKPFCDKLEGIKAQMLTIKPIYYINEADMVKTVPYTEPKALKHYLYGGLI